MTYEVERISLVMMTDMRFCACAVRRAVYWRCRQRSDVRFLYRLSAFDRSDSSKW